MKSIYYSLPLLVGSYLLLFLCTACKDENSSNNFTSTIVFPDTGTISFTKYVQPLLQQTCVASQCHGGSSPAADLDLTQPCWETLVYTSKHSPVLVVAKNPTSSLLYIRITGSNGYTRMPPEKYSALTTNQINGIKRWITQGALYN